uniref:Uncharacterized protein n=1 Tax=Clastoptera arizonana TaxID=38151 RepID=A0A1B6DJ66_9HEMI
MNIILTIIFVLVLTHELLGQILTSNRYKTVQIQTKNKKSELELNKDVKQIFSPINEKRHVTKKYTADEFAMETEKILEMKEYINKLLKERSDHFYINSQLVISKMKDRFTNVSIKIDDLLESYVNRTNYYFVKTIEFINQLHKTNKKNMIKNFIKQEKIYFEKKALQCYKQVRNLLEHSIKYIQLLGNIALKHTFYIFDLEKEFNLEHLLKIEQSRNYLKSVKQRVKQLRQEALNGIKTVVNRFLNHIKNLEVKKKNFIYNFWINKMYVLNDIIKNGITRKHLQNIINGIINRKYLQNYNLESPFPEKFLQDKALLKIYTLSSDPKEKQFMIHIEKSIKNTFEKIKHGIGNLISCYNIESNEYYNC